MQPITSVNHLKCHLAYDFQISKKSDLQISKKSDLHLPRKTNADRVEKQSNQEDIFYEIHHHLNSLKY